MKVKGVVPELPSALSAFNGVIDNMLPVAGISSLRIVPVAVAVVMVELLGLDKVTVKVSLGSTTLSPLTLTVISLVVSPAAKVTVLDGNIPPAKSSAVAGLLPVPVTNQLAVLIPVVSPLRLTVKVKGMSPSLPSNLVALVGAIARLASSF